MPDQTPTQQLADAFARLRGSKPYLTGDPSSQDDINLLISEYFRSHSELTQIDSLLARRNALDNFKTRFDKIQHTIMTAKEVDHLKNVVKTLHEMIRGVKRIVNTFVEEGEEKLDPPAKKHLLDLYSALGIKWGQDPFPKIRYMRQHTTTVMDDGHCSDCDRPELCDAILPGSGPCGKNRGSTPTEPVDVNSRTKSNQRIQPQEGNMI